jgi:hypothetical protein
MACRITRIMRHMEIQCGRDGMKNAQFNSELGATLRILLNMIAEDNKGLKHLVQGFGLHGCKWIFQVEQYHRLFPKEFTESALRKLPEVFTLC